MEKINLFKSSQGWVSNIDLLDTLKMVAAHKCKILYIHTGMSFGIPNPELKKKEILKAIFDVIMELKVPTVCMPTFTFSFCNGDVFDVQNSKSKMGAINEYFRKMPDAIRSIDPLMSIVLIGDDKDLAIGIGKESIGINSTFHKLHFREGVKFLFLGTKIGDCFTYMHFIEKFLELPCRYDRNFTGRIIDNGKEYEDTFTLYVRYKNVLPGTGSYEYEKYMIEKGIAKKEYCGDSFVISVDEEPAFQTYEQFIKKDINYFMDPNSVYDGDKTFEVKDMVAL